MKETIDEMAEAYGPAPASPLVIDVPDKAALDMPLVYIAGPYTAATPWEVEQNIRRAEALILPVAEAGGSPVCPHTNTRFHNGTMSYEFWIQATLALMLRCDAVLLAPGWPDSKGALGEIEAAHRHGIPVVYSITELAAWIAYR